MKVRLAGIIEESITDGPGLRIILFFQGCDHRCPGCHNPQTWSHQAGTEYELNKLLDQLQDTPLIKGVTLSGGDPFYQPVAAAYIAREFHSRGKDVWAYTGFLWEDLLGERDPAILDLVHQCDVIVDGPFIQSKRRLNLHYRGSLNQRLIAVRESLQKGGIVEWAPSNEVTRYQANSQYI
jgi:anaerobic ribonucleoside-triphosphate reductase activating protein